MRTEPERTAPVGSYTSTDGRHRLSFHAFPRRGPDAPAISAGPKGSSLALRPWRFRGSSYVHFMSVFYPETAES